ncbi:MAG TPA: hypothetical protein VMW25_01500, partial [Clostridia bacterium]|nr:hypothetical protein [Clostridia bacterium]
MTEQRELYYITDPKDTNSFNRILSRIAERLDVTEGLKGYASFKKISSYGNDLTAAVKAIST